MSVCFCLCMLLRGRKEEMVFIQENRIEHRVYDVTCKPWLLASDSLDGSPFHIALNIARNFEFAVGREIAIDFQEPFLQSFRSSACTNINELPHEFVQHLLFLPFFECLPRRALVEIKVLEIERQLRLLVIHFALIPHIGSTTIQSSGALEFVVKLTLLFCCHTP